jgi:hypothetical protein
LWLGAVFEGCGNRFLEAAASLILGPVEKAVGDRKQLGVAVRMNRSDCCLTRCYGVVAGACRETGIERSDLKATTSPITAFDRLARSAARQTCAKFEWVIVPNGDAGESASSSHRRESIPVPTRTKTSANRNGSNARPLGANC